MRDGSGTSDTRPSYFNFNLLNLKLREECSRTLGMGWNSWGYKRTQSGSSSRSGCNRGAAAEADPIGAEACVYRVCVYMCVCVCARMYV